MNQKFQNASFDKLSSMFDEFCIEAGGGPFSSFSEFNHLNAFHCKVAIQEEV